MFRKFRKFKKSENQDGFTLIEVVLVVAIMGALASIAVPMFQGMVSQSYDAAAKSDVTNIVKATTAYISAGDGGTIQLAGNSVSCDDYPSVFTLTEGVNGSVMGFSSDTISDCFLMINLTHEKGRKTYVYTFDGASGNTVFLEI